VTIPQQALPQPAVPGRPPPLRVIPQPGDALDDLLDRYEIALARVAEAKAQADTIDAAIKNLITSAYASYVQAGVTVFDIEGAAHRPARRLAWQAKRLFDKDRFSAEHPGEYERYLKWGRGFWGWRKPS
jgi:hypothetical protein